MYAFQFCGSIFYRAFKDISTGTELLVWYDVHYPQFIGIPLGLKDIQLISSLGLYCIIDLLLFTLLWDTSITGRHLQVPLYRPLCN